MSKYYGAIMFYNSFKIHKIPEIFSIKMFSKFGKVLNVTWYAL